MNDKTLTLLPKGNLPQKAKNEIEIARQFNAIKSDDFYYSKEFGLINIFIPKPQLNARLNKFNVSNIKKQIDITVINPDNLNSKNFKDEYYALNNLRNIAEKLTSGKDLASAYVSSDDLPGYKILANSKEFESLQGDLIFTKEYNILFIQVLDIHEANFKKVNGKWITEEEFRDELAKDKIDEDNFCSRCGITEEEFYKTHPRRINYLNYNPLDSFFTDADNNHFCGPCHKETQLEKLFDLMDKKEKKGDVT